MRKCVFVILFGNNKSADQTIRSATFVVCCLESKITESVFEIFKILVSLCSLADKFESYQIANCIFLRLSINYLLSCHIYLVMFVFCLKR